MAVEFRAIHDKTDLYRIDVYINERFAGTVSFVDMPAGRVCRVDCTDFGWRGSKSQAESGADQVQELYDKGIII